MTRKLFLLSFLLVCLCVCGFANPGLAQDKMDHDVIAQLQGQGWTIVNEGVLKRELRPHEVEYFVFGVKGFTWKLEDLKMQYRRLQAAYRATPTAELKKAIANHRKEMGSTMKMIDRARTSEQQGLIDTPKESCTISFSYDASASYKATPQGLWADARSSFNANCAGFIGEVYAYAYAEVTVAGGPLTKAVTDGPRSGANVTAAAYSDLNGTPSCNSYAYSSVTSNNLNPSSYSKAATNYSCPPVIDPPVPTISGPTWVDLRTVFCKTVTWTSSVIKGTSPYTYSWTVDWSQNATSASFSMYVCRGWYGGFTLGLDVKDANNLTGSTARWIDVLEPTCTDPCTCPMALAQPIICQ